jgi:hypothetical protein
MNDNDGSNIAENNPKDMVSENKMGGKYADPVLFPADQLISKMGRNLEKAELLTHEHPLWTKKTAELQKKGKRNF